MYGAREGVGYERERLMVVGLREKIRCRDRGGRGGG